MPNRMKKIKLVLFKTSLKIKKTKKNFDTSN